MKFTHLLLAVPFALITVQAKGQSNEESRPGAAVEYEALTETKVGFKIPLAVISDMAVSRPSQSTLVSKQCQHTLARYSVEHSKAKEGSTASELTERGLLLKIDGTNQAALRGMEHMVMVSYDEKTKLHRTLIAQPVQRGSAPKLRLADEDSTKALDKAFPALDYRCDLELFVSDEQAFSIARKASSLLDVEFVTGSPIAKQYESRDIALAEHLRIVSAVREIHTPTRTVYWIQYIGDTPAYTVTSSWEGDTGSGVHLVTDFLEGKWQTYLTFAQVRAWNSPTP